jgi:hypothetical protein
MPSLLPNPLSMDIRFNCPRCNQNLSVEERGAGMLVNCPNCNQQIEIPRRAAPPPLPPSVITAGQVKRGRPLSLEWTIRVLMCAAVLAAIFVVPLISSSRERKQDAEDKRFTNKYTYAISKESTKISELTGAIKTREQKNEVMEIILDAQTREERYLDKWRYAKSRQERIELEQKELEEST